MTAREIIDRLAEKHRADVFITECKYAESAINGRRMDAWAMKKSWARLTTYGYEVKVTRSDFKRDTKWKQYLPYCHYFSFVCPKGLIEPHEIPYGIGLLYVNENGVYTRTPARCRHETKDADVFMVLRYITMWRSEIIPVETRAMRLARFRREMELRALMCHTGDKYRHKIARELSEMEDKIHALTRQKSLMSSDIHYLNITVAMLKEQLAEKMQGQPA